MRRSQSASHGTDTIEQHIGDRNKMVSRSITVDHDISIVGMLPLDDIDNILISKDTSIWKYHDMLLARLRNADKTDVKIHLRPHLLNVNVEQYAPYLAEGVEVNLWDSDATPALRRQDNLTLVRMKPETHQRAEGFLIIKTPLSSRILAAWQDADGNTVGVLVTNPHTIDRVCERLDAIIQSAA